MRSTHAVAIYIYVSKFFCSVHTVCEGKKESFKTSHKKSNKEEKKAKNTKKTKKDKREQCSKKEKAKIKMEIKKSEKAKSLQCNIKKI